MNPDVVLASNYRLMATNFRISAEVIHGHFQSKGESLPRNIRAIPFYYLVSHASELLLKSALLKRSIPESLLKKPTIRHNLKNLTKELEEAGATLSEDSKEIVKKLSEQHEGHYLRYSALSEDGKSVFMPEPLMVFKMLDELLLSTRISR